MKSLYLGVAAVAVLVGSCAEPPSGSALQDGPGFGLADAATRGADQTVRYGPSGRYGRPAGGRTLPRAAGSDAR